MSGGAISRNPPIAILERHARATSRGALLADCRFSTGPRADLLVASQICETARNARTRGTITVAMCTVVRNAGLTETIETRTCAAVTRRGGAGKTLRCSGYLRRNAKPRCTQASHKSGARRVVCRERISRHCYLERETYIDRNDMA